MTRPCIFIQHVISADGSSRIEHAECSVCGARFSTPIEAYWHQQDNHPTAPATS